MKNYQKISIFIFTLLLMVKPSFAAPNSEQATIIPAYDPFPYNQEIEQLLQATASRHAPDIQTRIATISAYFLGRPYSLGPAGEGANSRYDQSPLYRTDVFDCMTYVNTVVALAESNNLAQFQRHLKNINYRDGKPVFISRNHFVETDWNSNNARKGYISDITPRIVDTHDKPIFAIHQVVIDKPNWFLAMKPSQLKFLQPLSPAATQQRFRELQNESVNFSKQVSQLPYLPVTRLYDTRQQPISYIFNQIPSGAIVEIVNPKPGFKNQIGTPLYVSHVGLAVRTSEGLMFREASSYLGRVVDIPLARYLLKYLKFNEGTGINIQEVVKI